MVPTNFLSVFSLVGEDPFLCMVELIGKTVGESVERFGHLPDNHLEKDGGRLHLETPAQLLAGGFNGVQLMPTAGNEDALG